jgi:hypothetical protein
MQLQQQKELELLSLQLLLGLEERAEWLFSEFLERPLMSQAGSLLIIYPATPSIYQTQLPMKPVIHYG